MGLMSSAACVYSDRFYPYWSASRALPRAIGETPSMSRNKNCGRQPLHFGVAERHAAVTEADMGDLDQCRHAVQHHDLVAPVKLVGFARRETQRQIGFYARRTASPASRSGIATDRVVSAFVAKAA